MLAIPAPMLASAGGKPFTDPAWLYEIKFDGYRTLAAIAKDDGFVPATDAERYAHKAARVQLRTKSGADCSAWYPEVVEALAALPGGPYMVDGEACVLDELGRSDFNRLQDRARRRRWYPGCDQVTLCVFDLLMDQGRNIMGLPLVERKARLARLLADVPQRTVLMVGDLPAEAALFDQAVMPLQLEALSPSAR